MVLHKLLRGALAGTYLPFARAKLRFMEAMNPEGFFRQKFSFGGYLIDVQQAPPFQYIRITEEGVFVFYEMFTPDHVGDGTLASPGHEGGFTASYVCGSATRSGFGQSVATPKALSSSTLTGGDWVIRDCESSDMATLGFWTSQSWQNQKFFEHCWHPDNDGKSLVTSTQAQAPGLLAGQCGWLSAYIYRRIASTGSIISDFTLDVKPTYYKGELVVSGGPLLDHDWIWWRRAAVHSASGRQFFISTDNYGRFQIYPLKDYSADGNIVHVYYQLTPPYPAWVTVPPPADVNCLINDWLWRFNKDATKCVSIPYHSAFGGGFYKYLDGVAYFATLTATSAALVHPSYASHVIPAREDTPGLVEFGIEIEITGPDEFDFIPHFTVLRTEHFDDNQRFFFDAAYTLPDVEHAAEDPNFVPEDTLVTAEIECKYAAGYYTATSVDGNYRDSAGNVTGDWVINLNDASLVPSREVHRVPTLPGQCRQFLTPAGRDNPLAEESEIGSMLPFGTGTPVMTYVPSGGPVGYQPPSPFPPVDTDFLLHSYQGSLLFALELSTLAWNYELHDTTAGTYSKRLYVYGEQVFKEDGVFTEPEAPLGWPAADTKMLPVKWYQYLLNVTINTEFGSGFSVHPHGHWAHSVNAEQGGTHLAPEFGAAWAPQLDLISVKAPNGGGRSAYKHRDLFNAAFGQTREYLFYTEAYPGKQFWDMGSFRSAGIWVTYRER